MTRTIGYIYQSPIATKVDLVSANIKLERQKEEMRSHAAWFQLSICDTFIEPNSSSSSILERCGLQLALRRMKEIQACSLLVNSLGDLATSSTDLEFLLSRYFAKGFTLLCGSERIRSDTPDGWAYLERKYKQPEVAHQAF